jgi:hypothetical protein
MRKIISILFVLVSFSAFAQKQVTYGDGAIVLSNISKKPSKKLEDSVIYLNPNTERELLENEKLIQNLSNPEWIKERIEFAKQMNESIVRTLLRTRGDSVYFKSYKPGKIIISKK